MATEPAPPNNLPIDVLIYQALENAEQPLQEQEIAVQASLLGKETEQLWNMLARKAAAEVAGRRGGG